MNPSHSPGDRSKGDRRRALLYPDAPESRQRRSKAQRDRVLGSLTDEDLVTLALEGDAAGFEVLLERYVSVLTGYLYGKVRGMTELEDLLQEIFVTAYRKLGDLRNPGRFGPWLIVIARHHLYDLARRRRRPETVWTRTDADGTVGPLSEHLATEDPGPAERAMAAELELHVHEALSVLSEKLRLPVYLRVVDQLPPALIAKRLGISSSAVRVRLHRGLEQLRGELRRRQVLEHDEPD